jgi:3,4-dihydroxy-2-butanone 4-phosphate synthase
MDDLEVFSSQHGLKIISIDDLVKYRMGATSEIC